MKKKAQAVLTGRDHTLIGKALFIAARALRAQSHPPEADIAGMNDLLDRYYPRDKQMYEWQTNLELALRLGFQPTPGELKKEDVERWIAEHLPEGPSVVELDARRGGHGA